MSAIMATPCRLKSSPVVGLISMCMLLQACEPEPQKDGSEICAQAAGFIERNSLELQEPRDWNRLMVAGSRLVYLNNDCGELVIEPKEALCVSLSDAIFNFEINPSIPAGPNRNSALAVANQTFGQSGCDDF